MSLTIERDLSALRERGLYRSLTIFSGVDFASNDFLGLAHSPRIRAEVSAYLAAGGALGSTGSRLVSGESHQIRAAEKELAEMFLVPATLFFGSGYLANLGVTGALATPESEFFSDAHNHASLIDGMRLSRAKISVFRHGDLDHLQELLKRSSAGRKIVVTESIFSMDGDGPDLLRLKSMVNNAGAFLILDEAHATGVMGKTGRGCAEGVDFDFGRTFIVHTCGKALGGYGAFVATSAGLRDLLINRARSFIFSTAPTGVQVVQTLAAVRQVLREPELIHALRRNVESLRPRVAGAAGHILSILMPGNERVLAAAEILNKNGLFVKAIRSPTVREGRERLRVTVKSFHTEAQLMRLAELLHQVAR